MDFKTLIIAQLLITLFMSATMSGIMSAFAIGLTQEWLTEWPRQFITAWPIAFILTQIASRIAFPLAAKLRRLF